MGVTCPDCGTDNTQDSEFCKKCGTQIRESEEKPLPTQTIEAPREELTTGSTFAGRYQIIEELGKGGMGRVYKAQDTELKEKVALKLIKPEISADKKTVERFQNELKFTRKIVHKNVGRMYELGKEEGSYYITMEFVEGQDLKGMIRQSKQLTSGTAISITKQVSEGLEEAHRLGVIHRDLKPSNVMIDKDGNARIMDFGIARSIEGKGITGAGVMIGTPEYMPPEQAEAKDVDQRSDIYALGIILYEMVTGRVPFEGDSALSIAMKHKSEEPKDPREFNTQLSEDLSRVILRCLEKDKDKRYQSAGEVRSELANIEQSIPTTERIIPERKPLTSREITVQFSLKKLFIPALIVIAIAIIGVIIWQFLPQKETILAPKIDNSIAVISFKNRTGDPSYDYLQEVIPNLLITNLENTGLFYVTTWERMQDILKQMGVKQAGVIDSELGFELCRREGIEAIAIGTFSKAGDVFIMDVKVLDAETKRTLKSTNTKGTGADSIFDSQIDELSRDISLGLGAGLDKVEAAQLNIKGITTHSLEAYQYFLKGKEACNMAYWATARKNLERALEIDPSFAMAYVYLAWTYFEPRQEKPLVETIEKGIALSDRVSQKDRLYLDGLYAYFVEQDTTKAVMYLDDLLQKYPDEKWALHISGDFVRMDGYLEGAYARYKKWLELDLQDANALWHFSLISLLMGDLEIVEQYIKMHEVVAPPVPGNLVRQAQIYLMMGQVDKAIAKRKEALEVHPDLISPMLSLVTLYSLKEDYDEALRWANEYMSQASSLGQKWNSYYYRGFIDLKRGTFDEALADYTMAVQIAEQLKNLVNKASALERKGFAYFAKGEYEASRKSYENMLMLLSEYDIETPPTRRADWAFDMGMLALEQGQIGQANTRLSEIKSLLPEMNMEQASLYNLLMDLLQGEVLLAQGALDEALDAGKRACGPESPYWKPGQRLYWLQAYQIDLTARIYAKKGDIGQAISEYERLLKTNFSTGFYFHINPLFHYRLGLLYERANMTAKAKAQFEKFLTLWKDADPGIAEVDDARKRLAGLR